MTVMMTVVTRRENSSTVTTGDEDMIPNQMLQQPFEDQSGSDEDLITVTTDKNVGKISLGIMRMKILLLQVKCNKIQCLLKIYMKTLVRTVMNSIRYNGNCSI